MSRSNIEEIKASAFDSTINLIEIKLPPRLKKIDYYAFVSTSLPEIVLPASIEYIDVFAVFELTSINKFSFDGECANYEIVNTSLVSKTDNRLMRAVISTTVFDTDVAIIGTSAFSKTNLETFIAGPSLKLIDRYGFINAKKLKKIDFSKCQIQALGEYAFWSTPISSITLPYTVNSMDKRIFEACNRLKSVLYLGSTNFSSHNIFPSQNIQVFVTNQYKYETFGNLIVIKIMDYEIPDAIMRAKFTCGTTNVYYINKLLFFVFIIL